MIYAIYPYAGFEQPFYVLAEVSRPRRRFPMAVITTMLAIFVIYPLVHFSYFCVVDLDTFTGSTEIFTVFIRTISNGDSDKEKATSAIIAIFIFGNLFVQTYTAARVKQEIAKEGILPFSLFFTSQYASSWAFLRQKFRQGRAQNTETEPEDHDEEVPVTATFLHWLSYGISFTTVCWMSPRVAYNYLTFIHAYVIVVLLGALTAGGLLYLKLDSLIYPRSGRRWSEKIVWTTKLGPIPAFIYFIISTFLVFACFAPVHNFARVLPGKNWVATLVGLSSIFWGVAWWSGLKLVQWMGRWTLIPERFPWLELDEDDQYVRKGERVVLRRSYDQ